MQRVCSSQAPQWTSPAARRAAVVLLMNIFASALILPTLCSVAIAGEESVIDGIVHVRNGTKPQEGIEEIRLAELWRAGGEDDEIFFGSIGKMLLGPDGNIYILDEQLVQTFVYAPDGEFLRTLGRQGEGPGEVRSLNDIIFLPDGSLGLGQAFPGRVVKIGLDGTPGSSFMVGATGANEGPPAVFVEGRTRGETILIAGMRMEFRDQGAVEQHLFLSRYSPAGAEQHVYATKEYPVNFANFTLDEKGISFVWACFDADADGNVYFAPYRNRYEIHVCDPRANLTRVITREYETLKRDAAMKREARLTLEAVARSYGVPLQGVTIEDAEPDIEALHNAPDGTLWVRTSRADRKEPEGILTTFDVFDTAGHFQKQVRLRAPGDASKDAIHMLGADRLAVVVGAVDAYRTEKGVSSETGEEIGEAAPLEVIVYAL